MKTHEKHRVVISGLGMVTPLGNDVTSTWQGLIAGRSGISAIPETFGLQDYPVKVIGLVTGEKPLLDLALAPKSHSKTDRFAQLGIIAGHQAMLDAKLSKTEPFVRDRFGAYMGVGVGGLMSVSDGVHDFDQGGAKRVSPFIIPKSIGNIAPAWLTMLWDLHGPHATITNACASSTDSVGLAFRLIRDGYVDYMLAGGTESCSLPLTIAGFGNIRALSTWPGEPTKASRPFDVDRSGFVLSEGAAVLVLERAETALQRGANIYAEVVGYGATSEAYHITAMHPEAHGAVNTMKAALADAGIDAEQVGYVNAHGTSTPMNDALETMALKKVFGAAIDPAQPNHILVSSTKSMTGHMLGAAGAVEAAVTALALQQQLFPPTINLDTPDPACDLDYIPHIPRHAHVEYALSNSFGFGGGNSVLALKRWV
jgi:3-oxoacyl-[acyl-carrier-protein] synthase II